MQTALTSSPGRTLPIRYNRAFRIHSECHERRSQSPADRPAPDRAEERRPGSRRHPHPAGAPQAGEPRRLRHQPRAATRQAPQAQPARARRSAAGRAAAVEAGRQGRGGRRRLHQLHARLGRQDRGGARGAGQGRGLRPRRCQGRQGAGGVRLRQPDRAAPRRPRPRCGLRGLALGRARLRRLRGQPRILRERRRSPDGHPGAVDLAALPRLLRRRGALSAQRLPGRLRDRHGPRHARRPPGPLRQGHPRAGARRHARPAAFRSQGRRVQAAARGAPRRADRQRQEAARRGLPLGAWLRAQRATRRWPRGPAGVRRALRQVVLGAEPVRHRPGRARGDPAREGRPHLPAGRRQVVPLHRLRRREGPRRAA